MNTVIQFERSASRSRGTHEGESSPGLCDRLCRTRDFSQRQLPTDHDYAVPTREYQTDQSSFQAARLPLALRSKNNSKNKNHPTNVQRLTGSLHISPRGKATRSTQFPKDEYQSCSGIGTAMKALCQSGTYFVSGHDFSRAVNAKKQTWALAPEEISFLHCQTFAHATPVAGTRLIFSFRKCSTGEVRSAAHWPLQLVFALHPGRRRSAPSWLVSETP